MAEVDAQRRRAGAGTGWRVLVVDDAAGNRLNMSVAVKGFDPTISILEAESGRQALEVIGREQPDIVFISLQLPDMTGAEVLAVARMKGMKALTALMSSLVLPKWVELSTELDAYEFLKKPIDPEHIVHLLGTMRRMLTPSRMLLVEESPAARQLIRRMFTGSRFALEIDETDDGRHGLKLLRLKAYDLMVIDYRHRGADGLEIACQARDASPETRIVLTSGGEVTNQAQAAKHFGISALLKKPFYARDVDSTLHTAFGLRRPYLLNALRKAQQQAAAPAKAAAR